MYVAGENLKKGDLLILGEDEKTVYKANKDSEPTQIFYSFFDEFTFGKFKGKILSEVLDRNPKYVQWCCTNNIIDVNKKILDRFDRNLEIALRLK